MQQGRGECQSLLHAVRVGLGKVIEKVLEPKVLSLAMDDLFGVVQTPNVGGKSQELAAGKLVIEEGLFGHVADVARGMMRFVRHVMTANARRCPRSAEAARLTS